MRIGFDITSGDSVAVYSDSLIRGVVLNNVLAKQSIHVPTTINFNSSCVFFAVAFLEAKLNETITGISEYGSSAGNIPSKIWQILKLNEKKLSLIDKWNFLASAYGGKTWEKGENPFQSFEAIRVLRNELVHYKGERQSTGKTPKFSLNFLLEEFSGEDTQDSYEEFWQILSSGRKDWLTQILSSKDFGNWIAKKTLPFDIKFEQLILSKRKKDYLYWSKWDPSLNFTKERPKNLDDTDEVLQFLEKVVFPF